MPTTQINKPKDGGCRNSRLFLLTKLGTSINQRSKIQLDPAMPYLSGNLNLSISLSRAWLFLARQAGTWRDKRGRAACRTNKINQAQRSKLHGNLSHTQGTVTVWQCGPSEPCLLFLHACRTRTITRRCNEHRGSAECQNKACTRTRNGLENHNRKNADGALLDRVP